MFSGSTRASRSASRPDTTPMLTCGSKNVESSDAITMSDVVTRSRPAPAQMPFTAQISGFVISRYGSVASCGAFHCRADARSSSPCGSRPLV